MILIDLHRIVGSWKVSSLPGRFRENGRSSNEQGNIGRD